jgi:hypothetical protein
MVKLHDAVVTRELMLHAEPEGQGLTFGGVRRVVLS